MGPGAFAMADCRWVYRGPELLLCPAATEGDSLPDKEITFIRGKEQSEQRVLPPRGQATDRHARQQLLKLFGPGEFRWKVDRVFNKILGDKVNLHVIARGKIARSPEAELVARYEKRISWPLKISELPETGGKTPDPQTPFKTVLLDERGKQFGSESFASLLGGWRDDGMREARFILGAADGHTKQERQEADVLMAFGSATWPHLLARAMLMEQLYRATTILAGHPYHRAN